MKISTGLIGIAWLCCATHAQATPIAQPTPGRMLIEQYEGTETMFVPPGFIADHDIVGDIHSGRSDLDDEEILIHANISDDPVSVSDRLVVQDSDPPAAVPEPTSLVIMGTALVSLGLIGRRRKKATPENPKKATPDNA